MDFPFRFRVVIRLILGAVLAALLWAGAAHAQLFSPGALSKPHSALDGLTGCTQCHLEGAGHDNNKCLSCHDEIRVRLLAKRGYHGSFPQRPCFECHREHRGGASLVEWKPSRELFNHNQTGWPLVGSHKMRGCRDCHEPLRMEDKVARGLLNNGRDTWLGLGTQCVSCHFDEHRGQEGRDCQRCHRIEAWKRAIDFNHNDRQDARFPLLGRHKKLSCTECHLPLRETKAAGAFPKPTSETYLQLKDIPHESCLDCHKDHHDGGFGTDCARCHTPDSWRTIKADAQDKGAHDKHAFKLRGQHSGVSCRACHGPFPGIPAKFKGLKFKNCADCHLDAHVGQIASADGTVKCEECHDVRGFVPVRFNVERHNQTRLPLVDAHRTIACALCHTTRPRLTDRVPASAREAMFLRGRPVTISTARIQMPEAIGDGPGGNCAACHAEQSPHGRQFAEPVDGLNPKGCRECHTAKSFNEVVFDHDQSRFPLSGRHKDAACGSCHISDSRTSIIVFRPISPSCTTCHDDVHQGQFASFVDGETDCAACHNTAAFKPSTFVHDKQSRFKLEGAHGSTTCDSCHRGISMDGKVAPRYKPLPVTCGGCHEDDHKGSFDSFRPPSDATQQSLPSGERCDVCHSAESWWPARFAHELTTFELTGRHKEARCASCHGGDLHRPLPKSCASCHADPHQQEFGLMCASCHTTTRFEGPLFPVDAHRSTNFPLTGRHSALPCDECHVEKRERQFTRAAIDCVACHQADAIRASSVTLNHQVPPFSLACGSCHTPTTFTGAKFRQHDVCFPITRGTHTAIRCTDCHSGLRGVRVLGNCDDVAVRCAECHTHRVAVEARHHARVAGYEHKSQKCAQCHKNTAGQ